MALFSERNGLRKVPNNMLPGRITGELRNRLWNLVSASIRPSKYDDTTFWIWHEIYCEITDARPFTYDALGNKQYDKAWAVVREDFLTKCSWHRVYDYLELFVEQKLIPEEYINSMLKGDAAAYRMVGGQIVQLTEQSEIDEINNALSLKDRHAVVSQHISASLALLSRRDNPDYRNSIKESILAVEAMAKLLTDNPKATLGMVLNKLEKDGRLNGALKSGFSALYGWTSDTNGIRHALTEDANVDSAEATFFLVACSAFVNYLKQR